MKIFAVLLLCGHLPPMRCAPVIDEAPSKHNHSQVRDQRLFSDNTFDSGDTDVSGQVHGHDVSIGSSVDIEVGQSGSKSPPPPAPVVAKPTKTPGLLPPSFTEVPGYELCLGKENLGSYTSWCFPAHKPEACKHESWVKLSYHMGELDPCSKNKPSVDPELNVSSLSSLESSVASLLATVGDLTTKMEVITAKVEANEAAIANKNVDPELNASSLESSVASLLATVGDITTKMEVITPKVEANEAAIANKNEKLWRDDGRCGQDYLLPSGKPGQCDPAANENEKGPCCSQHGWCGNTDEHCECSSCVNYAGPVVYFIAGGDNAKRDIEIYDPSDANVACSVTPPALTDDWTVHSTFYYGNTIYLCGGWHHATSCISHTPGNGWKTHSLSSERRQALSTVVLQDRVYFIGGVDTSNNLRGVDSAPLPLAESAVLTPVANVDYNGKHQCVARVDQDTFVITGGENNGFLRTASTYNSKTGTFTHLPQLKQARSLHGCGVWKEGDKKWIIVAGGLNPGNLKTTEMLEVGGTEWISSEDLNVARAGHSMAITQGGVMVLGGRTIGGADLSSVEMFDWSTKTWSLVEPSLNKEKSYFGGAVEIPASLFGCTAFDCWSSCGKKDGGACSWCGSNGFCCRKGFDGCPSGAGDVSPDRHRCVRQKGSNWELIKSDDCWNKDGKKTVSCDQGDAELNESSLESSVASLLATVGNLTTKMEAISAQVDLNKAGVKSNQVQLKNNQDTLNRVVQATG